MGIQEGTFVKNYFENIDDELLDAVENSVVGSLIYQGLLDKSNEWLGTRKELMEKLRTDYRDFGNLPRSLKAITSELVRIEPALYKLGIIIDLNYPRSGSGRNIHIYRKNPIPIHSEKRRIERIRRIIKQPESQASDSLAATR
jgi:hypothetical protein